MVVGIARNPYATNVHDALVACARQHDVAHRSIDLASVTVEVGGAGEVTVADRSGPVAVDSLAPYLVFGFPAAVAAVRALASTALVCNPVDAVLTADDKAATAVCLAAAGVAQVGTTICAEDLDQVRAVAHAIGFPVVLKRTHGARGRWVRRAYDESSLAKAFAELAEDGPGALVCQPLVEESLGTSLRAIITGGRVLAASQRHAGDGEWRSNIAAGATQQAVALSAAEHALALAAAGAVGLGHAGVDLLRTNAGPVVLEVNSCPDFTSMLVLFDEDLTHAVLRAVLTG